MRTLIKRAIFRYLPQRDFLPNDVCVSHAPSPQSTVEIIDGWHCAYPDGIGVDTGGYAKVFDDTRVPWGVEQLGGVKGADILELGPLEGAHTYMLDRAGAKSIVAIEGLKRGYLKCLITKELLGIKSANFLLGDFVAWLESEERTFDVIWASGVLYHMTEPLKLLRLIAAHTDRVFLWTHFYPDDFAPHPPFPQPLVRIKNVPFEGRLVPHFERSYMMTKSASFCGGVYSGCAWLRRRDILDALSVLGFSRIEIGFEDRSNEREPSFALVARRERT
jgi:hypothetical protein